MSVKNIGREKISGEYAAKDYLQDFNQITQALSSGLDFNEWINIYQKLVNWSIELDKHREIGLEQSLNDQYKEANKEFSKFVERNYISWLSANEKSDAPNLSPQITEKYVLKHLRDEGKSIFISFLIACALINGW